MDAVEEAHQALKDLFMGSDGPFGHPHHVQSGFHDWEREQGYGLTFEDLSEDHVRGHRQLNEETAEIVLEWINEEHRQEVIE